MRQGDLPVQLDLGDGRTWVWVTNKDGNVIGGIESHPSPADTWAHKAGEPCSGSVYFDVPGSYGDRPRWHVVSWQPLTITPSLLCRVCGNHGFIREGKWVPA